MTELVSVKSLSRDLASAAATLTDDEARYLFNEYYVWQENRKRSDNQVRALGEAAQPNSVLAWLADQSSTLEEQIKRALDKYTNAHEMGQWMRDVYGIGPVLSAGLLAQIDIEKAPTVGHIYSFAGLDPSKKWGKGQRRPWNADLKRLCWLIGQSFMKFSNKDDCFYGKIYRERKVWEIERNDEGGNREEALRLSNDIKAPDTHAWLIGRYPAGTMVKMSKLDGDKRVKFLDKARLKEATGVPMLSPAHVDARARRFTVKLFLSHLHGEWIRVHFKREPPLPYPMGIQGHAHMIEYPKAA